MPHVVTQSCSSDASCVFACPVNCIHPTPDEPDFLTAEMLHIDPAACVDCGACVSACPVDAIVPQSKLLQSQERYLSINADFYREPRPRPILAPVLDPPAVVGERGVLRVAIVGSGPAAMYAAEELLTLRYVQVDMYERLSRPYGLVRGGVAPDHQKTKQVSSLFDHIADDPKFTMFLNVDVGKDISHEELAARHHAVIYAVGASSDRRLDIEGSELAGTATEFVAWYNGHPDFVNKQFDLSAKRAVIIGNGNVALDVARILTIDPERLAGTDISPSALAALRVSNIEEVVIVGRRGIAQSAFTVPEFAGLIDTPGIDVQVEPSAMELDPATALAEEQSTLGHAVEQKLRLLREVAARTDNRQGKRITLRYLSTPTRILGEGQPTAVEFARNILVAGAAQPTGDTEVVDAGLVLSSIGYRGTPLAQLPFDETAGVVPNEAGRVTGTAAAGSYVTGWIKRGPTGFIGTNKSCAQETVHTLVDDFNKGLLPAPKVVRPTLRRSMVRRAAALIAPRNL